MLADDVAVAAVKALVQMADGIEGVRPPLALLFSLPLNRAGRLAGDVENHPVHPLHLVHDPV